MWILQTRPTINKNQAPFRWMAAMVFDIWTAFRLVLSLFRILRRNGYHSGNNNDFCAVMSSIYHTTVPKYENYTLLKMYASAVDVEKQAELQPFHRCSDFVFAKKGVLLDPHSLSYPHFQSPDWELHHSRHRLHGRAHKRVSIQNRKHFAAH